MNKQDENKYFKFNLDLQTFADKEDPEEGKEEQQEEEEQTATNTSDGTENTEEEEAEGKIPYDRFKQKVDEVNALKERLAKLEADEEEKRKTELEEQERYKELYEEQLQKLEETKAAQQEQSKKSALAEAGYADEQIQFMLKLVEGETEEEVAKSIEVLKATFPTKKSYVDPSADNGARKTPKAVDGEDYGKEMFKRLFDKGKLRGFKKD